MTNEVIAKKYPPRGKGVKPAMVLISIRVPRTTLEYYKSIGNHTVEMRKVLDREAGGSHGGA